MRTLRPKNDVAEKNQLDYFFAPILHLLQVLFVFRRNPMRQFLIICLLFCAPLSGCTLLQWVAPHQLWKLNRQPAIGGEDGYFSIPADAPSETSQTEFDKK